MPLRVHPPDTVVPGFSVLGFRALSTGNQILFYSMNLPGFSALPGFKAPFYGEGQSALNPGSTVLPRCLQSQHFPKQEF